MDDSQGPRAQIERADGPVYFINTTLSEPEIPDDDARECPQCKRKAWKRSRWCWNCKFDFDRAALPRVHPSKIAFLSLLVNALLCFILGFVIYTAHNC